MTRLVIKTFLDRPKWATATAFSGAGLPEDDEDYHKDLPADESMLDLGAIKKKPKGSTPPPSHGPEPDHGHAHDLPQDESMLDMGKIGKAHAAPSSHDAHDPHAAHDAGHGGGHGHDDDAGHGGHGHHGEPHESPPSMLLALVVLAIGSVLVGFLGVPPALGGKNLFEEWLSPVTGHPGAHAEAAHGAAHGTEHAAGHEAKAVAHEEKGEGHEHNPMEYVLMLVSIAAAVGGIGAAWYVYKIRSGVPAQDFVAKHQELYELVRDKYRVDELYRATVVEPLLDLNEGTCRFDNEVVDGAVNGAAWVGRTVSKGTGLVDNEVVDAAVNGAAVATQMVAKKVRRAQTGNIKEYLTFALVGGLFVIALFCLYLTRENLAAKIREMFGG